jgi:hypothetical protein
MVSHPCKNCDLTVWFLPLTVISLGDVDLILSYR